jgi:hypothetical protein
VTKDVSFEPVSDNVNDAISYAYRAKYTSSPYLAHMAGKRARAVTVRILSRV